MLRLLFGGTPNATCRNVCFALETLQASYCVDRFARGGSSALVLLTRYFTHILTFTLTCSMSQKRIIRIGLLGFGVVGQGVWKNIEKNRLALEFRLGAQLDITQVVVNNLSKEREVAVPAECYSDDPSRVVDNPEIDIVCELMGGTGEALELTRRALQQGKIVVTANKALICEHGEELFKIAHENGGHYFYEASVAGGIPIIKTIREALVANRFKLIFGILNGTSNYILTRMEREGLSFDETLGDARKLGYVEADEALDLDGMMPRIRR